MFFTYCTAIILTLATLLLLLLSLLVLILAKQPTTVNSVAIVVMILNTLLLCIGLRWASDPYFQLARLVVFLVWIDKHVNNIADRMKSKPVRAEEQHKQFSATFTFLIFWGVCVRFLQHGIDSFAKNKIVPLFTLLLFLLFGTTVTSYGVTVHSLQHLPTKPFSQFDDPGWLPSFAFSISMLTTAPLPNISPSTDLGYALYTMELISTFLIISVFGAMFSATMGIHGPDRKKELETLLANLQEGQINKMVVLAIEMAQNQPPPPPDNHPQPP